MTTPTDDVKALIAEGRNYAANAEGYIDGLLNRFADALARHHAIVERVKALGCRLYSQGDEELLQEALTPPAEQPPRGECEHEWHKGDPGQEICVLCPASRSEARFCGVTMDIGGVEVACTSELPCETHSRETPAVAKCNCGHTWVHHRTVGCLVGRCTCLNEPPAAQPKPSPDRSAMKCGRLIVSDRLCNNSAGHDGDCSYVAPPDEDGEAESLKRHIANAEAYYEALERQIDTKPNRSEAKDDNYVAWLRYRNGTIKVCDSDSEGAFKVWRHPPLAPHEIDNGEAQSKARARTAIAAENAKTPDARERAIGALNQALTCAGIRFGFSDKYAVEIVDAILAAAKTPEGSTGRGDV